MSYTDCNMTVDPPSYPVVSSTKTRGFTAVQTTWLSRQGVPLRRTRDAFILRTNVLESCGHSSSTRYRRFYQRCLRRMKCIQLAVSTAGAMHYCMQQYRNNFGPGTYCCGVAVVRFHQILFFLPTYIYIRTAINSTTVYHTPFI